MVKPWALFIFLLANGGDGAWVSTPPRQNYGYSSYKNNYQSTSLNSITSQLKDLNWKVSKYKEQLYKAEDEIDNLWVSEVGQDYKIQSLEGKDKQHEGRLYSTEVNNARQDEEIDSLETKTAVNSGQISDNDDDILDLQAKQDELCTTVGDAGDSVNDPSGLVGQVAALETNCCGEAVLGQDIADLQTNCCGEAGLGQDIADLQDNCCGEAGLGQDIADLQTNCCGEASLGQDIADLQMSVTEVTNELADKVAALEMDCCDEGDMRLTSLEMTVDDDASGLVQKVAALEDDLDKDGGVLDCLVDLKTTVNTHITGLVYKVAALEMVPIQCMIYNLLLNGDRSIDHISTNPFTCDNLALADDFKENPEWKGEGWYRLAGAAGCKIPEIAPDDFRCGTVASGWMYDTPPTGLYETKDSVKFCFIYNINPCNSFTIGRVTNCGLYYVYFLPNTANCASAYCGTN